ncbi:hypothetical protein M422DRAFT_40535 [Sphaerobolus stellatus SS14]|nr:hypothetical protein M422DRAFT_40535 [Sphaerobolus stellatus SS14]
MADVDRFKDQNEFPVPPGILYQILYLAATYNLCDQCIVSSKDSRFPSWNAFIAFSQVCQQFHEVSLTLMCVMVHGELDEHGNAALYEDDDSNLVTLQAEVGPIVRAGKDPLLSAEDERSSWVPINYPGVLEVYWRGIVYRLKTCAMLDDRLSLTPPSGQLAAMLRDVLQDDSSGESFLIEKSLVYLALSVLINSGA